MLSKLYKKNLFKKYNGIIFIRGGDHHSHGGKPNAHHNEHHDHHGEHHDDHHDHHDDHHHNPLSYGAGGTWYEIFGGKKYDAPRRYNIHGERIVPGQKRLMKFYEMPIYLGVGLSIAITLGFLYFFPYESKNEWAREEIRIRRDKRSSESEETKTARRQMVSSFLAESTTQVKLDKVASPSVWLDSSFDKFLENKSLEIMSLLQRPNTTEDILSESKILEEGYTISQNLKLRNDSNKEIDLLQYLISSSGNDLSDTDKINSQLKQDLLKNNNLRDDLQLGINVSPSNQLIYDREFCSSFNNVLQMRIASHDLKTVSSKGFTI